MHDPDCCWFCRGTKAIMTAGFAALALVAGAATMADAARGDLRQVATGLFATILYATAAWQAWRIVDLTVRQFDRLLDWLEKKFFGKITE